VVYNRNRDDYNVQHGQNGFVFVYDQEGNGGTDTLNTVERIIFKDDVVFL
jgi:hypothetical protein